MCEICYNSPCLAGCPNAEEVVVHYCCECGEPIYEGDYFYEINGEPWCAECIHNCRKEARG